MNESADPRAKAQGRDELPPLPIGELMGSATINGARIELYRYTEQHMRDYARLALSQREEGLREALAEAIDVIHSWYGDEAWDIYLEHSPEMRRIRAPLEATKGKP